MAWIAVILLQGVMLWSGIRSAEHAGRWSWSKFAFSLAFAALECMILIVPIWLIDLKSHYFWPVYAAAWVIAALNFIWFIRSARRWKLPDGRTSLEADHEDRQR